MRVTYNLPVIVGDSCLRAHSRTHYPPSPFLHSLHNTCTHCLSGFLTQKITKIIKTLSNLVQQTAFLVFFFIYFLLPFKVELLVSTKTKPIFLEAEVGDFCCHVYGSDQPPFVKKKYMFYFMFTDDHFWCIRVSLRT